MILFRKFERKDWDAITDPVEVGFKGCIEDFFASLKNGVSVTAVEDGNVVGVGGIVLYGDNCGEAWIKLSRSAVAKKTFRTLERIKTAFAIFGRSFGPLRLTSHVLEGFRAAERLVKFLGFEKTKESEMFNDRKYNLYEVADWNN